jgi:hypothetical protein
VTGASVTGASWRRTFDLQGQCDWSFRQRHQLSGIGRCRVLDFALERNSVGLGVGASV